MDVETKIKEDMRRLGCDSEMKICLAYHLYIYLVDEKLMYDTEYCYNSDIETLYVVGRSANNENLNIFVPTSTQDDLSMEYINKLQENLCTVETGSRINLAFIDADFTIVIYTFSKGIVDRQSDNAMSGLRQVTERRRFINCELRKKREEILNDALNGGFVDDDDCEILN